MNLCGSKNYIFLVKNMLLIFVILLLTDLLKYSLYKSLLALEKYDIKKKIIADIKNLIISDTKMFLNDMKSRKYNEIPINKAVIKGNIKTIKNLIYS